MKILHRPANVIAVTAAVMVFVALASTWGARPASALNFGRLTTGMAGVARGQTFRTSVVNTGEERGFVTNWTVFNGAGEAVVTSREPARLALGQAAFFDFRFDEFPTESIRGEFRAVVVVEGALGNGVSFVVGGEVFDNDTGKTASTQTFEECACGIR